MTTKPTRTPHSVGAVKAKPFPTVAVIVAVVIVVGVGIVLALAGGSEPKGTTALDAPVFGPITTSGNALPAFDKDTPDPASGAVAPRIDGRTPDDAAVSVGGAGKPTLIAFVAHWCPHCQAEVPRIVGLAKAGDLDGVRLVAVLTGTNPDAPNFPPAAWLQREDWPGDVLLDDDKFTAATAYGLAEYPFLVAVDADGHVVARSSGELPPEQVVELARQAQGL